MSRFCDVSKLKLDRVIPWLERLESGTELQIGGALARTSIDGTVAYCCLGVACQMRADVDSNFVRVDYDLMTEFRYSTGRRITSLWDRNMCVWFGYIPTDQSADAENVTVSLESVLQVVDDSHFWNHCSDHDLSESRYRHYGITASEMNDCFGMTFEQIAMVLRIEWGLVGVTL